MALRPDRRFSLWRYVRSLFARREIPDSQANWLPKIGRVLLYILIPVIFIAIGYWWGSQHRKVDNPIGRLERGLEKAVSEKDVPRQILILSELLQHVPKDDAYRFALAKANWEVGKDEESLVLLESITKSQQLSYGPAHAYLAPILIDRLDKNPSTEQLKAISRHLELAILHDPEDISSRKLLADILLRQGATLQAETQMVEVAKRESLYWINVMTYFAKSGQQDKALGAAVKAELNLQPLVKAKSDDANIYRGLGLVLGYLKRFPESEKMYKRALELDNGNNKTEVALIELYRVWGFSVGCDTREKYLKQKEILDRGLALRPTEENLLLQLAMATFECREAIDVPSQIQNMFDNDTATKGMYYARGTQAIRQGRTDDAIKDLEKALDLDSDNPVIANRLAIALYNVGDDESFVRAAKIANALTELRPNDLNVAELRGHLLVRQGKFQEGIDVLEGVLARSKNRINVYESLGLSYRKLGRIGLAEKFEKRASELSRKNMAKTQD